MSETRILAVLNSDELNGVSSHRSLIEEMVRRGYSIDTIFSDKIHNIDSVKLSFTDTGSMLHAFLVGKDYKRPVQSYSGYIWGHPSLSIDIYTKTPTKFLTFTHNCLTQQLMSLQYFLDAYKIPTYYGLSNYLRSKDKPIQLYFAAKSGFNLPDTVITNDYRSILEFYNKHNCKIIVKTLAGGPIPNGMIYTTKVTEKYLADINKVSYIPAIYQQELQKKYELRITVVSGKLFCAKIDSQNSEFGKTDWRKTWSEGGPKISLIELPAEIKSKVITFMRLLGLEYGSIDMVVDSEGKYYFLEVNRNGQWEFIERLTGAKITESVADLLESKLLKS